MDKEESSIMTRNWLTEQIRAAQATLDAFEPWEQEAIMAMVNDTIYSKKPEMQPK